MTAAPRRAMPPVLRGVGLIARGRAQGLNCFRDTPQAFLYSLAPGLGIMAAPSPRASPKGPAPRALAEIPGTLCVLLAPRVLSYELARFWGREAFWNRYIVAFNWCQWLLPVIAFVLLVGLSLAQFAGVDRGNRHCAVAGGLPRRLRVVAELVSRPPWPGAERLARRRAGGRGQSRNHRDCVRADAAGGEFQMSVIGSVASGVHGALLLARGRPEGVQLVDTDQTAVIRSFWAIPLSLPCRGLSEAARLARHRHARQCAGGTGPLSDAVPGRLAGCSSGCRIIWPRGCNRQAQWPRFIAIWAYCSIIENTLVAIGGLPGALGAPSILDQASQLVTIGWALWLEWYAIRLVCRSDR